MKTIVIVADTDPRRDVIGGIPIYSKNLMYHMQKKYDVIFIGKNIGGTIAHPVKADIRLIGAPGDSNIKFLLNLYRMNKDFIPNDAIVHVQRPDWALPFKSWKTIVTLHGSHSKNVYMKKGPFFGTAYAMLERKGLRTASKVIAVSKIDGEEYKKKYGIKYEHIPVGIDYDSFQIKGKRKKTIVFVGRLEPEKNLEMLIDAVMQVGAKLLIIGDGSVKEDHMGFSKNIGADVTFLGSVKNEELPKILSECNCFALSSFHEGLPIVALEAMAAGLPVISTPVGDMVHLIKDGKNGYLADKDYAVKLKELLRKSNSMRDNCRKTAKRYDWENIGNEIGGIYDSIH